MDAFHILAAEAEVLAVALVGAGTVTGAEEPVVLADKVELEVAAVAAELIVVAVTATGIEIEVAAGVGTEELQRLRLEQVQPIVPVSVAETCRVLVW